MKKHLFGATLALFMTAVAGTFTASVSPAYAITIKYVVNNVPITSDDIAHRAAFLRLQHKKGDAAQEMIDQTLRMAEARRIGVRISDQQVNDAYTRFATSNKMKVAQLDAIMAKAGVTKDHFKDYIRSQMAWNAALSARFRAEQGGVGGMSEQDAVRHMLDNGGSKPTAMEYMLQQVIFVVPKAERSATLAKRKREAQAMRDRFNGCATTRAFAKGLIDVTVRDLGRILAPQLPPDWSDEIKKTKIGGATPVRETERGVEFIGICSAHEVSDDKVAQMVFQSEANGTAGKGQNDQAAALSEKYMAELKQKARIVQR